MTLSEGWTWSGGTLNLCLDGKTIFGNDVSGSVLSVAGGKLNLYDEGDGAVTQTDGKADTIHVAAGSVFSLYGGTVSGALDSHSGVAADGSFHMAGGAVSGNDRGVLVNAGGTFTVSGSVQMKDNTRGNVCLQESCVIGISGALSADSRIGVTVKCSGAITQDLSGKGAAENFFSDGGYWQIGLNADGEVIFEHIHRFSFKAVGSAIMATCAYPEFCDLPGGTATLRVLAPKKTEFGDGKKAEATVQGEIPGIATPDVVYRKDEVILNAAPISAGKYTAGITVDTSEGALTATISYKIRKATPDYEIPTGLTAVYGQTLADVSLARWPGWAWANSAVPVEEPGLQEQELQYYRAFYTPEDTENYEIVSKGLEITVEKAPNPAYITPMVYLTKDDAPIDLSPDKSDQYIRLNGATGAITYAISGETDICSLSEGGVLTPGSQTGDVIVTVKIAEENKYEALERNITVTVTGKSTAFLTVAQSNTIYGTPLYDPDVNGQPPAPVENTSILYQGTEWDGLPFGPTEEKPTKAGSYQVTVIYETKPTVYTGVADFVIYPQSLANAEVELDKEEFIPMASEKP
ncbi:MAG: hypothetical protein K5746_08240 [Clostridiales bacterium]|nr:hypothetical protein [Clostridiales bacterium]